MVGRRESNTSDHPAITPPTWPAAKQRVQNAGLSTTSDDMTKKLIRRIALAMGGLLLLLIAVAAYLIMSFDANSYKAQAIAWMKTERQRSLAIDGPIKLSVFPRLAVRVSGLRLSERNSDAQFVAIDDASLSVQVMPLLNKRLVVDRVSARGVGVAYKRDASGAQNFDDLLGKTEDPTPADKDSVSTGGPLSLAVSAISLENLRLKLNDEQAGLVGDVTVESFKSGRLAHQVETPVSFKANVVMRQPQAVKLTLGGSMKLTPDLEQAGVALTDLKLELGGDVGVHVGVEAAGVKRLAMTLNGNLAWAKGRLQAGPLKLSLASASHGKNTLSASTIEVKRALFDPKSQKLELEAFDAAITGLLGKDAFEVALNWPKLAVDDSTLSGSALSGRYKLAGATALAGQFQTAAPSGNFETLRLPGLDIRLEGSSGKRKVDGSVKADARLNLSKMAVAIENLNLQADLTEPALQPLKLGLRGKIDADAKTAAWNLEGALNANRFESDGQAVLGGKVPKITAKARFDKLDLNKLLTSEQAAPSEANTGKAPADTPIDLEGLRAVDGNFKLTAGQFVFRQYEVADARIEAALDDGTLRLSRLAGKTWGGSVETSGSAAAGSRRITVKLDAEGVDINALLKDVAGKDLLEGKGRVQADVSAQGATVGAMRASLAGTSSLRLRDGAIKGINLAQKFRQAKAAFSTKQDAVSQASLTEKTDFSELSASAKISNGVASSDDLELKSPFLRLGGAGTFDISQGRIDYTARTTLTAAATGQGGADLGALRGVTIPVLLSGPFEAIDWKIRWSEVAAAALTNTVKDKLADKLGIKLGTAAPAADAGSAPQAQKPKDVLKEKLLKGLFN